MLQVQVLEAREEIRREAFRHAVQHGRLGVKIFKRRVIEGGRHIAGASAQEELEKIGRKHAGTLRSMTT